MRASLTPRPAEESAAPPLPSLLHRHGLAGIPRVGTLPLDGRDLSPLLLKQGGEWPDRMLFASWNGQVSVRSQTHRLDAAGRLFNLVSDPGQLVPVNDREPDVATALSDAVKAWRREMFGGQAALPSGGYTRVDPRPIPTGYREFPITQLPARDGEPQGGIRRSSSAPNCSYFVNWTRLEDRMTWHLSVRTTGRYRVTVDYTCPMSDAGSRVELALDESRLSGVVTPGWDPPLYTHQDTLPRPVGESQMKEFRSLDLGVLELKAGEGDLVLRALEIPGRTVMDVRRVTLELLE